MKRVLLGLALGALTVGSAIAAPWIQFTGTGLGLSTSVWGKDAYGPAPAEYNYGPNQFVGQIKAKFSLDSGATYGTEFMTYCITPSSPLNPPNDWALNTNLSNLTYVYGGGDSVLDQVAQVVYNGWSSQGLNSTNAGAFQLALWCIVNDVNPGTFTTSYVNTGQFGSTSLTGSTLTAFNTYMGYASLTSFANMSIFRPLGANTHQILVSNLGGGGGSNVPVPEPFTVGLGVAAAAAFARRRIKAKKLA